MSVQASPYDGNNRNQYYQARDLLNRQLKSQQSHLLQIKIKMGEVYLRIKQNLSNQSEYYERKFQQLKTLYSQKTEEIAATEQALKKLYSDLVEQQANVFSTPSRTSALTRVEGHIHCLQEEAEKIKLSIGNPEDKEAIEARLMLAGISLNPHQLVIGADSKTRENVSLAFDRKVRKHVQFFQAQSTSPSSQTTPQVSTTTPLVKAMATLPDIHKSSASKPFFDSGKSVVDDF